MRPPGAFKISRARHERVKAIPPVTPTGGVDLVDDGLAGLLCSEQRSHRLLESLRNEIVEAGCAENLRIRQVFDKPREIYRLELTLPELGYQRTTLLDRDALEELLEADDVRDIVRTATFEP